MNLDDLKKIVEIIQAIATSLGIILAGVWTLWMFVFNRSFAGTLKITLDKKSVTVINGFPVVILTILISNVGRSKIVKDYCYFSFDTIEDPFPSKTNVILGNKPLDFIDARPVFGFVTEIEPGEEIKDEVAVVLDKKSFIKIGVKFKRRGSKETWEVANLFNFEEDIKTLENGH